MSETEQLRALLVRVCKWNMETLEVSLPLDVLNWFLENQKKEEPK